MTENQLNIHPKVMNHTQNSLYSLKINELKAIAAKMGVIPSGNKSYKRVWVESILEYQADALEVVNQKVVIDPCSKDQGQSQSQSVNENYNSQNQRAAVMIGLIVIMAFILISKIMILIGAVGIDIVVKATSRAIKIYRSFVRTAYFNVQSPMANYKEAILY